MSISDWFKKKPEGSTNSTSKNNGYINEIYLLLVNVATERHSDCLSKNMILTVAFRWQEPPGTRRPSDEEILKTLIANDLIQELAGNLDYYQVILPDKKPHV